MPHVELPILIGLSGMIPFRLSHFAQCKVQSEDCKVQNDGHVPMLLTLHFATMAADMVLLLCADSPNNERLATYLRFGVFLSTMWYFLNTGMLTMVGNLAGYFFIAACLQKKYIRTTKILSYTLNILIIIQ